MARRIVRTLIQFTVLSVVIAAIIFFLDIRYQLLPQRLHELLPEHHAGHVLTDVKYLSCTKISSCQMNAEEGWVRNKDVYLGQSWVSHGYIHYKRIKEEHFNAAQGDRVVVDIRVGRLQPNPAEGAGDKNIEWESRAGGIWIKRQSKMIDSAVTALDVLFGHDAVEVRPGWTLKENELTVGNNHARITVRRGRPQEVKKPVVRMRSDHKLKIVQISDLHLSTGTGLCREPEPASTEAGCEADPRTLQFITRILDDEKPDIAVLTGDQVNGETSPDAQTVIYKFAAPFIERKIPFATILGNHDDEGNLLREQIMKLTTVLPYSLSELGPQMGEMIKGHNKQIQREGGVGNYIVEILAHKNDHSAATLYFMDTHSYSPDPNVEGYDWIKDYQIDWFKEKHKSLQTEHNKYAFTHLDLSFIHIPLPEYRSKDKPIVGEWREGVTAPTHNSGFKDALVEAGVHVVSAGHDHANDYCMFDKQGIWMCYAGGSGFGGYGGYNKYNRRVRVFEIDAPLGRIRTWKRVEWEDSGPVDVQTIVEAGKAVVPHVA